MVTIAGSRAGKSRTILIPNLLAYRGPVVVIDPKGELAHETREHREKIGPVFVLDPFNKNKATHGHNPLRELSQSDSIPADAAQIADALIIPPERGDSHWTDAAKNLITGLILHSLTNGVMNPSIPMIRSNLARQDRFQDLLTDMSMNESFDGAVQAVGSSMLAKYTSVNGRPGPSDELRSILSVAMEQTRPLDDVRSVLTRHDFNMSDLAKNASVTIYLILPATRIATHHRWLRLFIYQLLATLERHPIPHRQDPLWLVLEEFAALGNLRQIETAAGYMAGMGIKLWAILQDLNQLKTHYPKSWETFLGNAGVIQAFGNVDRTTTSYLSDLLGQTVVTEAQSHFVSDAQRRHGDSGTRENLYSVPLISATEIAHYFARETGRQLVLVPGQLPTFFKRLGV